MGAALVNGAAIAGMVVIARRCGGAAFAFLVAIGCLVLVSAAGLEFVWDPWNPFVTVLPFGLALFATWGVLCGDRWCIPVLAVVGTYSAQTHVGYVPLVGILVLIATIMIVVDRVRSTGPRPSLRVPLLLTGGTLVLLWLPPVVQQLTTTPGNLQAIVDYFGSSQPVQGFHHGYDVVSAQFAWNADWIVGGPAVNPFSGATAAADTTSFPVWWLALAAAIIVAWRVGNRAARAFALVLVIAIGASVVAVARTIGPLVEYRLRFVWVLGMLTAVFALWMLGTVLARQAWWRAQVATVVLLVVVIGLSVYNVARAAGTATPNRLQGEVAATLSRQLVDRLPPGPGAVLFTVRSFEAGPLITGVMLDLERRGIPVALRDMLDDRLRFGAHRMLDHRPVRSEISFVVNDDIERASAPAVHTRARLLGGASAPGAHRRVARDQRCRGAAPRRHHHRSRRPSAPPSATHLPCRRPRCSRSGRPVPAAEARDRRPAVRRRARHPTTGRLVQVPSGRRNQPPAASEPPSAWIVVPVTKAERSDARNSATPGDVVGGAEATDRHPGGDAVALLVGHPLGVAHLERLGEVRRDRVDAHARVAEVDGETAREPGDRGLVRAVHRPVRDGAERLDRRDVHDAPPPRSIIPSTKARVQSST